MVIGTRSRDGTVVLGDEVVIVLFACAAEELESDHEEKNTNAGAGEHPFRRVLP